MFKAETHCHTREVSGCSRKSAKYMIKLYKEAGYSTVFISDHFQAGSLDVLGEIPWNEKMTIFLSGYYRAKYEGDLLGITVLPAAEICFDDSANHYLAYGITKEFLDAHPNLHKMSSAEFLPIARAVILSCNNNRGKIKARNCWGNSKNPRSSERGFFIII
ncbi:MAG: hypothetical protein J6D31_08510 [Clostridia bacterium]|nr:hypothetical protein [Clostridia bacterium]